MMPLSVVSRAQYLTSPVGAMRGEDYDATLMVKAVKGVSFGNYAIMMIGGRWVRVEDGNKDVAIDWFVEWAAAQVKDIAGPKVIVPVPSSKTTPASPPTFRTALIANKLAAATPCAVAAPHLRFKEERPSSNEEGGSRSASVIYKELILTEALPAGSVLLLDDVLTGGGHLKASTWLIEDAGRAVERALCCGRTMGSQLPDPFAVPPETIDLGR